LTDNNPYQTPQAVANDTSVAVEGLYVVAPLKFVVLMVATFGLYSLYWFYRQWAAVKLAERSDIWPVARSIFQVFFTHSLFDHVDTRLRMRQIAYRWSASTLATIYVFSVIAARVADRLSARSENIGFLDFFSIAMLAPVIWSLLGGQRAINALESDPQGLTNSHFGAANIAWIVLGSIGWILVLLGLFFMATGVV
jgi:hypothetical protein